MNLLPATVPEVDRAPPGSFRSGCTCCFRAVPTSGRIGAGWVLKRKGPDPVSPPPPLNSTPRYPGAAGPADSQLPPHLCPARRGQIWSWNVAPASEA